MVQHATAFGPVSRHTSGRVGVALCLLTAFAQFGRVNRGLAQRTCAVAEASRLTATRIDNVLHACFQTIPAACLYFSRVEIYDLPSGPLAERLDIELDPRRAFIGPFAIPVIVLHRHYLAHGNRIGCLQFLRPRSRHDRCAGITALGLNQS